MKDVKISFRCDGCETLITFPASEAGMVRDCPECGGWVDVPEANRRPIQEAPETWGRLQEELNQRYMEENLRQQRHMAQQLATSDQIQQRDREFMDRRDQLADRAERLLDRFERIAASFESLRERWEDQP